MECEECKKGEYSITYYTPCKPWNSVTIPYCEEHGVQETVKQALLHNPFVKVHDDLKTKAYSLIELARRKYGEDFEAELTSGLEEFGYRKYKAMLEKGVELVTH